MIQYRNFFQMTKEIEKLSSAKLWAGLCSFFSVQRHLLPLIAMLGGAVVYSPILNNFFIQDDFLHLYDAANLNFIEFILKPHGGHLYILRNLIFYLSKQVFGLQAEFYFAMVLATHLLNIFLLFHVILNFSDGKYIAFLGSMLWGINPLNLGTLGWYSAYGHVLSGTFLLWILYDISNVCSGKGRIAPSTLIKWILILAAGACSFGTGIAIAMVFAPVTWLLLFGREKRGAGTLSLLSLVIIIPFIYSFSNWLYQSISHQPTIAGDLVNFLLSPGIFKKIIILLYNLLAYALTCALLGPFMPMVETTLYPTLFGILLVGFLSGFTWVFIKEPIGQRYRMLAFLILLSAIYGVISVGRAQFFTFSGIDYIKIILSTKRYHYVGTIAIFVLLCFIFKKTLSQIESADTFLRPVVVFLALFMAGWSYKIVYADKTHRGIKERKEFNRIITEFESLISLSDRGQEVFIPNCHLKSIQIFLTGLKGFPRCAAIFVMAYPTNTVRGRRIYFVEPEEEAVEFLKRRKETRIADLLITKKAYYRPPPPPIHD